jgi:phage major head subunit gpT-like protein
MLLNTANLTNLWIGYQAAFNTGFRSVTPTWQQIATRVPSSTMTEQYGWLGQFPRLREWLGDRVVRNMTAHDYTIKNKKFESTISVNRDEIEDDQYGVYAPLMQEMGFAAATHPDELVYELLTTGDTALCYDGQPFFDADHPVMGASVSNVATGSVNPWFLFDTSRPLKPLIFQERRAYDIRSFNRLDEESVFMTDKYLYGVDGRCNVGFGFWQQAFMSTDDLDATNFNAAYAGMMSLRSEENRPLGIKPNVLVYGPSNRAAALTVIKAERDAAGAANTNQNAVGLLEIPWLL